jgi:hypothetical protein
MEGAIVPEFQAERMIRRLEVHDRFPLTIPRRIKLQYLQRQPLEITSYSLAISE